MKTKNVLLLVVLVSAVAALFASYSYENYASYTFPGSDSTSPPLTDQEFEKYQLELEATMKSNNAFVAISTLRDSLQANPSLARDCHPLLHHLGRSAYSFYGNFSEALKYNDQFCNSGYLHGVIEAHFSQSDDLEQTIATSCKLPSEKSFSDWQCFHGMGHGIMSATSKSLPRTIELCYKITEQFAVRSCINGAFMEHFVVINHTGAIHSEHKNVSVNDCRSQELQNKPDCYFYSPTAYLTLHPNDYHGAYDTCLGVESDHIYDCIYGVGGQAMKDNINNPTVAKEVCEAMKREYITHCIEGSISLLINHYGATEPMASMCDTLYSHYQNTCKTKIDSWNTTYL